MNQKVIHKRSNVVTNGTPKLPSTEKMDYGELAINYADGHETITIKNSNNDIVSFKSQEYIDDNDLFTKGAGEDSIVRKNGGKSTATGGCAFAEGSDVTASGDSSHAEGNATVASGNGAHTEGDMTIASGNGAHAQGCCNYSDTTFIDCIGIGAGDTARKNAEITYYNSNKASDDKNGYKYLLGIGGYTGQSIGDAKSLQEVIAELQSSTASETAVVTSEVPTETLNNSGSTIWQGWDGEIGSSKSYKVGEKGNIAFSLLSIKTSDNIVVTLNSCVLNVPTPTYQGAGVYNYTIPNICLQKYNHIAISIKST